MKTKRVNGYLYPVEDSTGLDLGLQQPEEQSAEEFLAAQGVPEDEIKKLIIGCE